MQLKQSKPQGAGIDPACREYFSKTGPEDY